LRASVTSTSHRPGAAAGPAGPLAALTALAHVPDVRLNALDPFTAHELYVLRREVETALGARARHGD